MRKVLVCFLVSLLFASPAFATNYYVRTGGSNAHACSSTNDDAHAKQTVAAGLTCLAAGDTLNINDGTYTEGIEYNAIPDGIDDSNHTVVQAINTGMVTLNGHEANGFVAAISGSYKTVRGLVLDESTATTGYVGLYYWATAPVPANHMLIEDVEVKNVNGGTSACITAGGNGDEVHHITMRRLSVHDCIGGTPTTHGIYMHMRDSIVENSTIHGIAGYGIQQYTGAFGIALDNNIIRNNTIYDVGQDGTSYGGIYAASSDSLLIYNNVLFNSGGPGSGIQISATTGSGIYNNVIDGFAAAGGISGFMRESASGADLTATARNNIGWNNTPLNTIVGTGFATQDHNLCASGAGCPVTTDPMFVNEGAGDFTLSPGSPAIAAGMDLSGIFTTDMDGQTRIAPWDLGPLKFIAVSSIVPIVMDHVRSRH